MAANTHRVLGDHDRQIANLSRYGLISEVVGARARVKIGDLETDLLPWLTRRAAADAEWWAPSVGEQVAVLAMHGDVSQGLILGSVMQDAYPLAAKGSVWGKRFRDGTRLTYDPDSHELVIEAAHSPVTITCKSATIKADSIELDTPSLHCTGDVTVDGDLTAKGTSVHKHSHGGVKAGGDSTSPPL